MHNPSSPAYLITIFFRSHLPKYFEVSLNDTFLRPRHWKKTFLSFGTNFRSIWITKIRDFFPQVFSKSGSCKEIFWMAEISGQTFRSMFLNALTNTCVCLNHDIGWKLTFDFFSLSFPPSNALCEKVLCVSLQFHFGGSNKNNKKLFTPMRRKSNLEPDRAWGREEAISIERDRKLSFPLFAFLLEYSDEDS